MDGPTPVARADPRFRPGGHVAASESRSSWTSWPNHVLQSDVTVGSFPSSTSTWAASARWSSASVRARLRGFCRGFHDGFLTECAVDSFQGHSDGLSHAKKPHDEPAVHAKCASSATRRCPVLSRDSTSIATSVVTGREHGSQLGSLIHGQQLVEIHRRPLPMGTRLPDVAGSPLATVVSLDTTAELVKDALTDHFPETTILRRDETSCADKLDRRWMARDATRERSTRRHPAV